MLKAIVAAAFLSLTLPTLGFAAPREAMLVSTGWVAEHLNDADLVILQVGDRAGYDAGHIPGARFVTLQDLAAPPPGQPPLTLEMPDAALLREKLVALGVTDRSKIVVAPMRDLQSATRIIFTLDAAGLGERTVLLDGGVGAWQREQRPLTKDAPRIVAGTLAPLKMRPMVVDAEFVRSRSNAPGFKVVDARAPSFYSGQNAGGTALGPHKAGHIAGAGSVPFSSVTDAELKLLPADALAARFKDAGVKPGDTVIAYCHVGQQATAAIFAARTLGFNVLLYDGSFEDWSKRDLPVGASAAKAP